MVMSPALIQSDCCSYFDFYLLSFLVRASTLFGSARFRFFPKYPSRGAPYHLINSKHWLRPL
ncbi:hypothetical protein EMIT0324P_11414 [Pseudomonas chlororaphis]